MRSRRSRLGISWVALALAGAIAFACSGGDATPAGGASAGAGGDGAPDAGTTTQGGSHPQGGSKAQGGSLAQAGNEPVSGNGNAADDAGASSVMGGAPALGGEGGSRGGASPVGGAGGAGAEACPERELFGTYELAAHNELRTCQKSDFSCSAPKVLDVASTFSLYTARDAQGIVVGEFHGTGIKLGEGYGDTEEWDAPALIYYPEPGDNVDIWSDVFPNGSLDVWDPSRAKDWVRVVLDTCLEEFTTGFVHIDIELATGRVLGFARRCEHDFNTIYDTYRLSGTGQLSCELGACNQLENSAKTATVVKTAERDAMSGCEPASGTYWLKELRYADDNSGTCPAPLAPRETLVIEASSKTSGSLSLVSETGATPLRSTHTYQVNSQLTDENFKARWQCGAEALMQQTIDTASCSTAGSELELQLHDQSCLRYLTYLYEKQ